MKTIILIIALLGLSLINFAQTINTEAVELLYKEINFYRVRNDLPKCILNETTVKAAERWGKFMMSKHIDDKNNSYYHSNDGPVEYRNPKTTSEIIHVLYFNHEPSTVEIVAGLVYGIARNPNNPGETLTNVGNVIGLPNPGTGTVNSGVGAGMGAVLGGLAGSMYGRLSGNNPKTQRCCLRNPLKACTWAR